MDPSFEKKKANAEIGAIDVSKKIGKRLEVGFNRDERVKGTKGGAKKRRKRSSVRGGGRRNAMKERTRMGSFPNPDGSERKRARSIRISMEAKEDLT